MGKFIAFVLLCGVIAGGYYSVLPKSLPEEVISNTDKTDKYYNIITSNKNVILWSGVDNAENQDRDNKMRDLLRYNRFDRKFLYVADLATEEAFSCRNGSYKCMFFWMQRNCSNKYCIYYADTKKIVKVSFQDQDKLLKILSQ